MKKQMIPVSIAAAIQLDNIVQLVTIIITKKVKFQEEESKNAVF